MQKLIISMARLTAAMTLYGIEQVQTASNVTQSGQDLFKVVDNFEGTLNSMTEVLESRLDDGKRGTLKSVTDITKEVVGKSFDGVNMMDPRGFLRMTNQIWQKSTEAMSDWFGGSSRDDGAEPKPAADVLS
ncbi:MAG TPA: hypothetical protein VE398_14330 [Acidobacteriota bacterium]|nr:hypothetical protein [Acidobacteriota bacterium]